MQDIDGRFPISDRYGDKLSTLNNMNHYLNTKQILSMMMLVYLKITESISTLPDEETKKGLLVNQKYMTSDRSIYRIDFPRTPSCQKLEEPSSSPKKHFTHLGCIVNASLFCPLIKVSVS